MQDKDHPNYYGTSQVDCEDDSYEIHTIQRHNLQESIPDDLELSNQDKDNRLSQIIDQVWGTLGLEV